MQEDFPRRLINLNLGPVRLLDEKRRSHFDGGFLLAGARGFAHGVATSCSAFDRAACEWTVTLTTRLALFDDLDLTPRGGRSDALQYQAQPAGGEVAPDLCGPVQRLAHRADRGQILGLQLGFDYFILVS
jgi:hypothetical protein